MTERRAGRREVGEVVDAIGGRAVIYLRTADSIFYTTIRQQHFQDKDGEKVKAWALAKLRESRDVTWIPVIILSNEEAEDRREHTANGLRITDEICTIDFAMRRTYLAKVGAGKHISVRELPWDTHDLVRGAAERADQSREYIGGARAKLVDLDDLPHHDRDTFRGSIRLHVLPYDANVWTGLQAIRGAVNRARNDLKRILEDTAGLAILAAIGVHGLPSGGALRLTAGEKK